MATDILWHGYAEASPSLALIKYWGKTDDEKNIPATPSLAITLGGLTSSCRVALVNEDDQITVDGVAQDVARFKPLLDRIRKDSRQFGAADSYTGGFFIEGTNDFPGSAGLASSSSGIAAMTAACAAALGAETVAGANDQIKNETEIRTRMSAAALVGSASAARAVFPGFTALPDGADRATEVAGQDFWQDFRILVCITDSRAKQVSSRKGMSLTRETSPFYRAWLDNSKMLFENAERALEKRNLAELGPFIRLSYTRMHAAMFAADPPLIYWLPESLGIIRICENLRSSGIQAWETMDAGPQVKIFCLEDDIVKIEKTIAEKYPSVKFIRAYPGAGVRWKRLASL